MRLSEDDTQLLHRGSGGSFDSSFVPDGSVGGVWANHWRDNDFNFKFGARMKWEHNYPDYFPQAKSNPQAAWCYPENLHCPNLGGGCERITWAAGSFLLT